jgi:hypothetical protein
MILYYLDWVMGQLSDSGQEDRMSHHDHADRQSRPEGSFLTSRAGITLLVLLAIAGFLLFTEHRAHVLGAGLFLLLLACPLMHVFMHGGHGGHQGHSGNDDAPQSQRGSGRNGT